MPKTVLEHQITMMRDEFKRWEQNPNSPEWNSQMMARLYCVTEALNDEATRQREVMKDLKNAIARGLGL